LYDGKALTPIPECLARMIDVPRTAISPATAAGQIEIIDADSRAKTSCGCSRVI
jgi:hypothetical protein